MELGLEYGQADGELTVIPARGIIQEARSTGLPGEGYALDTRTKRRKQTPLFRGESQERLLGQG